MLFLDLLIHGLVNDLRPALLAVLFRNLLQLLNNEIPELSGTL